MDYVIERTHVIDHERFLEAGPHARDLWEWGMKYSGKFELDGAIPMAAVLASPWGYGGRGNIKAANRLVQVGLWERTDRGFQILRWTEQGNKTRAQLDAAREAAREKKRGQRTREAKSGISVVPESCPPSRPQGTPLGTPSDVINSTSYSSSDSGSDLGSRDQDQPDRSPTATTPPAWWSDAVATAEQAVGGTIDQVSARWLEYDAARERKGWARNRRDAVGWLTTVVRAERKNARASPPRAAEVTKQPFDPEASWIKLGDTGS